MAVLIAIAHKTVARRTCDPRGSYWLAEMVGSRPLALAADLGLE